MSNLTSRIIVRFCAEEVERQGRGPVQVADMVDAWSYALEESGKQATVITIGNILRLGSLVEPTKTYGQFRNVNVRIGNDVGLDWQLVQRAMTQWCGSLIDIKCEEDIGLRYYEFQKIHPFVDGNGRVGKILFNWLKGTLLHPVMPPDFFGISNP